MGNMGKSLDLARKLALRDYDIIVTRDTLSDGMVMYCAKSPELKGCIAQGRTVIEATKNLIDARVDYIYSLLLDMLPVPDPNSHKTGGDARYFVYESYGGVTTLDVSTMDGWRASVAPHIQIEPVKPTYIGAPNTPPVPYVLVDGVKYEPIWDGKVWVYKQGKGEKE